MSLTPGSRIGPYEVIEVIGAGGMGQVYRATDTRLKRHVAIKVLPADVGRDAERLARFQREAEVLASLNHPHIAAVYGLEENVETGGTNALVMELVEGATLADRIAHGPIPLDEALPIARQIAAALEAAHEQGIVHRDLKPANIKVRDDGTVKVLDFGLAKLAETAAARPSRDRDDPSHAATPMTPALSQTPTLASPAVTGAGMILGTAAYMSPEQARGRAVDKRTDIWAFGAVLYEMLTGRRAFDPSTSSGSSRAESRDEGDEVTDVIAEVVKTTPKWDALPASVPPHIVTLIQRCLEKDRNARIGDIAVARFLLSDHATSAIAAALPSSAAFEPRSRWRSALPWAVAALATIVALVLPFVLLGRRPGTGGTAGARLQMSIAPADQLTGSFSSSFRPARTAMVISPDGLRVVFAGITDKGSALLFVRDLDHPEATAIAGTENSLAPFFSPDGAWVGYWTPNKLRKIPAAGGPAADICEVPGGGRVWGASWADDGTIYFSSGSSIYKVSSAGGVPAAITTADGSKGERHLLPHVLPGNKALLFTTVNFADWTTANIVVLPLDGGEKRVVIENGSDPRFVPTAPGSSAGHLVYVRNGTLMAAPFDSGSRQLTGAPIALIENVMQGQNAGNGNDETGAGQFDVSASGTLLYLPGGINPIRQSSFVWLDRKGTVTTLPIPPGPNFSPRLSPDGRKIAASARRGATRAVDVWVFDVERGTPTRLTFEGDNGSPVWFPDSRRVAFATGFISSIAADGSGKPEPLTSSIIVQTPSSFRANLLAFLQRPDEEQFGIWVLPLDPAEAGSATATAQPRPASTHKPQLFLQSRFTLRYPDISPDGRWIAYTSNESENPEVYVQRYPDAGEKMRISLTGGVEPIWTANGRELLFRDNTATAQQFLSAAIRSQSPLTFDTPRVIVETKLEYDSTTPVRDWDVSADGQRFLLVRPLPSDEKPITAINVVLNWTEELKRLVPRK